MSAVGGLITMAMNIAKQGSLPQCGPSVGAVTAAGSAAGAMTGGAVMLK